MAQLGGPGWLLSRTDAGRPQLAGVQALRVHASQPTNAFCVGTKRLLVHTAAGAA